MVKPQKDTHQQLILDRQRYLKSNKLLSFSDSVWGVGIVRSDPCVAWYLVYATGWLVIQTPGPAVLGHFEFDAHPVGHRFSLDSSYCHCQNHINLYWHQFHIKRCLSCSCLLSCVYLLWTLRKQINIKSHQKCHQNQCFGVETKTPLVSCHLLPTKTIRFSDKTYRCHPPFTSPWGTRPCSRRNRSNPLETCPWVLFSPCKTKGVGFPTKVPNLWWVCRSQGVKNVYGCFQK